MLCTLDDGVNTKVSGFKILGNIICKFNLKKK